MHQVVGKHNQCDNFNARNGNLYLFLTEREQNVSTIGVKIINEFGYLVRGNLKTFINAQSYKSDVTNNHFGNTLFQFLILVVWTLWW